MIGFPSAKKAKNNEYAAAPTFEEEPPIFDVASTTSATISKQKKHVDHRSSTKIQERGGEKIINSARDSDDTNANVGFTSESFSDSCHWYRPKSRQPHRTGVERLMDNRYYSAAGNFILCGVSGSDKRRKEEEEEEEGGNTKQQNTTGVVAPRKTCVEVPFSMHEEWKRKDVFHYRLEDELSAASSQEEDEERMRRKRDEEEERCLQRQHHISLSSQFYTPAYYPLPLTHESPFQPQQQSFVAGKKVFLFGDQKEKRFSHNSYLDGSSPRASKKTSHSCFLHRQKINNEKEKEKEKEKERRAARNKVYSPVRCSSPILNCLPQSSHLGGGHFGGGQQGSMPPAMQLFQVLLFHLRAIGALPFLADVEFKADRVVLSIVPDSLLADEAMEELGLGEHPDQKASSYIPVTSLNVYPRLAMRQSTPGNSTTHFYQFPDMSFVREKELIVTFAILPAQYALFGQIPSSEGHGSDSLLVSNPTHPWEPSFLETQCLVSISTGTVSSMLALGLDAADVALHETLMDLVGDISHRTVLADDDDQEDWGKCSPVRSRLYRPGKKNLSRKDCQRGQRRKILPYVCRDYVERDLVQLAQKFSSSISSLEQKVKKTSSASFAQRKQQSSLTTTPPSSHLAKLASSLDIRYVEWEPFIRWFKQGVLLCTRRIWYLQKLEG